MGFKEIFESSINEDEKMKYMEVVISELETLLKAIKKRKYTFNDSVEIRKNIVELKNSLNIK
jgi:hypothetical protein